MWDVHIEVAREQPPSHDFSQHLMKQDVHFKVGFVSVVMRVIEKKGHERRRLTPIPIRHYSDPNESGDAFDDELVDCDGRDPDAVVERAFDHCRELGVRVGDWLSLGDW